MRNKNIISIVIFLPMLLQFTTLLDYPLAAVVRGMQLICFLYFIFKNIDVKYDYTNEKIAIFLNFILIIVTSMFTSYKSDISLTVMKRIFTILFPNLLLIYLTFSDDKPKKTFDHIMKIQMLSGILFSIYGIIVSMFGDWEYLEAHEIPIQVVNIGKIRLIQRVHGSTIPYRISSFLNNPNSLGILLVFTILSTLYLFKSKYINKYKASIFLFIQFLGMLLTQSRTAFITLIIAILLYLFILSKRKKQFIFLFLIIIPLLMAVTQLNSIGLEISLIKRFQNISLSGRENMWKILYNSFLDNYMMGIGFSTAYESLLGELELVSHNIYLRVLAEMGLVGFSFFIIHWLMGLFFSFRYIFKNKANQNKYIYAYVFSILFALIFHQLAEEQLLRYNYIMFLWTYYISLSVTDLSESESLMRKSVI